MSADRDRAIDRLLQRGVAAARLPQTTAVCLDGEQLAAWTAGTLPARESTRIEEHVADCARCQAMLAAFVRSEPPVAPHQPWWRSLHVRWLVPIAATAIVAAVWVALPERESEQLIQAPHGDQPSPAPQTVPLEQLRAAPDARTEQKAGQGVEQITEKPAPPPAPPAAPRIVQPAARAEDARRQAGDAARERAATAQPPLATESVAAAPPPAAAVPAAPGPYPQKLAETVTVTSGSQAVNRRAPLGDIASSDATTRWRIVNGTAIQRSTDSGTSWRDVEFTSPRSLYAGHSPAPSVVWLVGQTGTIYRTADGARFERVEFIDTSDLVAVTAVNTREATVTTTDGRRFRTTDGGSTWTRQ